MAKENKTTFRKNFERFLKSKDWETDEIKITDKIKCALIKKCKKEFCLYANYTDEEYENFMKSLEFVYDEGKFDDYNGNVWFEDGSWAVFKHDYDWLSGYWSYYRKPEIPSKLLEKSNENKETIV